MISIISANALLNKKKISRAKAPSPSQMLDIQEKFESYSRNNCLNLWVIIAMKIDGQ